MEAMVRPSTSTVYVQTGPALRLVPSQQWPQFHDALSRKSLAKAANKSLAYLNSMEPTRTFYRIGNKDIAVGELEATAQEIIHVVSESKDDQELNARLRQEFDLYQSVGSDGNGRVVFSSYYQPVLSASSKRTSKYKYPLYRKPKDLVLVDLAQFGRANGDPLLGRVTKDGRLVPYFTRRDIDVRKALAGRGLEIAWLADPFDRLALHIEGSGILKFPSGKVMLARYVATNSLPYKSVGTALVGSGVISKSDISYERLRQYLKDHPEGESWILAQNPRYTFFGLEPLSGEGEPFGTISQSLIPGRSIAIDPKAIPLGSVAYFETAMPQADVQGRLLGIFPTSRFALCQDTGGAIQGPGRVDIYVGHGEQAKTMATNQWAEGKLYIFLKKLPPRDR
jgi:membrane-bound lytic murein transglycosylase A